MRRSVWRRRGLRRARPCLCESRPSLDCFMPGAIRLLKIRRSVPPALLSEPGPDAGQLETLLTIAARVPDHGKLQPWRFIVYAGAARAKAGRIIEEAFVAR